jgi:DNA helicase-2/ATP-dependent DNA helicase PcrA
MLDLAREFHRLNDQQKEAVQHNGNAVVLAGPGSGKTATLVIKVAHLFASSILPPFGLACITYNNDTVREFRNRLAEFGIYASHRLFLGTVHSFCLNCVLRPYAGLVLPYMKADISVATDRKSDPILQDVLDQHEVNVSPADYRTTLTRFRRMVACNEDVSGFDSFNPLVFRDYKKALRERGLIDFEGMVEEALDLIRNQAWVRQCLTARFPWLIVDEYQDLGGPLHLIVSELVNREGISTFVVGDPDQTIYPFTGADPKYLESLAQRDDFRTIRLRFNYRSGRRLIEASQIALAPSEPRNYEPDPDRMDQGEVYFHEISGGLKGQAQHLAKNVISQLTSIGIELHEIAILYRQRGSLLQIILRELSEAGIPFVSEREGLYPRSPFVRWLHGCAAWCVSEVGSCEVLFEDILRFYRDLLISAGKSGTGAHDLQDRLHLYEALDDLEDPDMSLNEWLNLLDRKLDLHRTMFSTPDYCDAVEDMDQLLEGVESDGCLANETVSSFSYDGRIRGKIVVTTLHSSKGRQFDAVIMPGLQETILPRRSWNRRFRRYDQPSAKSLADDRRLFYVGFTRARKFVFLVFSRMFTNDYGYTIDLGPSRFVKEIQDKLEEN